MPINSIKQGFHELKAGNLHSGSPKGPVVKNPKQGIAIILSLKRKGFPSGSSKPKQAGKLTGGY